MSDSADKLARAQARSDAARRRLSLTLGELQQRLSPRMLARKAGDRIVETSSDLAEASISGARRHPARIAGLIAALGLLLARRRIARLIGLGGRDDATADGNRGLKDKRAKGHRRRTSS